jgi:ferredoxin-nitrite reductase
MGVILDTRHVKNMTSTMPAAEKLNKFEKFKAEKDGLAVKSELESFARMGWEAMDETDRVHRLKWLGVFFRPVHPGKFMVRLRLPSGILTSAQSRVLGEVIQRYGDEACADITTRQNIQLRGVRIEDLPEMFRQFGSIGLTAVQSGMDNVRNITASPVSGIDAAELIDTRELVQQVQDLITSDGQGNPRFSNLPRKFNIAIGGCPDNSIHAEINDIAFVPAFREGVIGFNVVVGGFFSASRVEPAVPLNVWVSPEQVVDFCDATLVLFRDHGPRASRQKSRLMWLIDMWGIEKLRSSIETQMGQTLHPASAKDEVNWEKRDHLGVYPQKQAGLNYVGLHVPAGRLTADDFLEFARVAEVYGSSEMRLTVEQNVILVNVPDSRVELLLQDDFLQKFPYNPGNLDRGMVSCTGAEFCNFAMIETKNRAIAITRELEAELDCPKPVRMHWTGCPNSCGQPQVADIGFMGSKARKDGKTVEAVDIFTGGRVGKDAHLGTKTHKGIPCEDLKTFLRTMLIQDFGAKLRPGVVIEAAIIPPTAAPAPTQAAPAVAVFATSGKEVSCTSEDLLLDVAEKAGLALDSSCRSGTCGTCKRKLLEGVVSYDGAPSALTAAEVASGYVLTCSARPVGRVVIDA